MNLNSTLRKAYKWVSSVIPAPCFSFVKWLLATMVPMAAIKGSGQGLARAIARQKFLLKAGCRKNLLALPDYYGKALQELFGKKQVTVTFIVNLASMFSAEPVMKKMLGDPRFKVRLCVIPDLRFKNTKGLQLTQHECWKELHERYDFAEEAVVEKDGKRVYRDVVKDSDIVFFASPYESIAHVLHGPFYAAWLGKPTVHLNYCFYADCYAAYVFSLLSYNTFWRVYQDTRPNMTEYAQYGLCEARNAVLSGCAKLDAIAPFLSARKEKERKKIIIAPHHSVDGGFNSVVQCSNFLRYSELFLELPKRYPDIDFVFRPHPALFALLQRDDFWGMEKTQEYIRRIEETPNMSYSKEGNYMQLFAESDGIIQDCGSFLLEYFYTGKPCCYMLKTPEYTKQMFSELGLRCLDHCYTAYKEEEIIHYMDEVIVKGEDPMAEDRARFAEEEIMINFPHVAETIIDDIATAVWGGKK